MNCCRYCIPDRHVNRLVWAEGKKGNCDFCGAWSRYLLDLENWDGDSDFWLRINFFCRNIEEALNAYDPQSDDELIGLDRLREFLVEIAATQDPANTDPQGNCVYRIPSREDVFIAVWPAVGENLSKERRTQLIGELFAVSSKWEAANSYMAEEYDELAGFYVPPLLHWEDFGRLLDAKSASGSQEHLKWGIDTLARLRIDLKANRRFYRARLGYRSKLQDWDADSNDIPAAPIPRALMGAPPVSKAIAGRISITGEPVLYLTTDVATAIAEMRPWKGALVTVANLNLAKDLTVLDLTNLQRRLSPLSGHLWDNIALQYLIADVPHTFSVPTDPRPNHSNLLAGKKWEKARGYEYSQGVARIIKRLNYDGIVYPSSMGRGRNIALFNIRSAVPLKTKLYAIDNVEYAVQPAPNAVIATGQVPEAFAPAGRLRRMSARQRRSDEIWRRIRFRKRGKPTKPSN